MISLLVLGFAFAQPNLRLVDIRRGEIPSSDGLGTQPLQVLIVRFRRFSIRAICVIRLIRDSDEFFLTFHASRITITPIAPLGLC